MLTEPHSAIKIERNHVQIGAPLFTSSTNPIIDNIRTGTAIFKTNACPRRSATFDQRGDENTVVKAATAVRAPAMEYLLSTECTNKMIAIESIATGMRAINPADAILFAPGVLKSSV